MYLDIEQVYWIDNYFDDYTTLMVFGYFYTFSGGMSLEAVDKTMGVILENLEDALENGATLEMDDNVGKVMYKSVHQTHIILN